MMTPDIEKIEHLLNAKTFEQLSTAERELVLAHLSGKAEYEHMRETLVRVKKIFTAEAAFVQAEADMKEFVLNRFEQNKPKSVTLFDKISTFFNTLIPSPAARFTMALGTVLVIVAVGIILWPTPQNEMAVNLEKEEAKSTAAVTADSEMLMQKLQEPPAPPADAQERMAVGESFKSELRDEASGVGAENYVVVAEDAAPIEELPAPQKPMTVDNSKVAMPVEQQNNVYLNNEGYWQYNNTRSAEALTPQKYTDAKKDYSLRRGKGDANNKKEVAKNQTETSTIESEKLMESKVVNQGSVTTYTGAGSVQDQTVAANVSAVSMPVWAGLENDASAYQKTVEKIKVFIVGNDAANLYRDGDDKQNLMTLQLLFNKRGQVIKATVIGDLSDTLKKEIERKALTMPAFKFTNGIGDNVILKQNYTISF